MSSKKCPELEFFDCNITIGTPMNRPVSAWDSPPSTAAELLKHMDRAGIRRALVWHVMQREHHPVVGNEQLVRAIRGCSRLVGCWAIIPNQTGELGDIEDFFAKARRENIRAFRVFPGTNRFLLRRSALGDLLDRIVEARIPLFVRMDEVTWENVYSLLEEVPDLRIVLTNMGLWGTDRYFRPLVESYQNVYIETTGYIVDGGIEAFVGRYGASRMLFGSGFPECYMGAMMLTLAHSEISDHEKKAIAAGNLTRLLSEVRI